jgi:hypothetical protein
MGKQDTLLTAHINKVCTVYKGQSVLNIKVKNWPSKKNIHQRFITINK